MRFAEPRMFWLLVVTVPLLAVFYWWAWRKRQTLISQFVQSRLLSILTAGVSATRQRVRIGLILAAVSLIFIALARPQWGFTWEEAHQRGLDIVVAIDTSRSMLATDIAPNRLARAKLAALDLMKRSGSDRLGLVAFAGAAFLQCPLTVDEDAFRQSLNALDTDIIPQGGTAIAEAIEAANEAFSHEEDNHKVLVLFTDGEDHEEGAVEAAKKAAESGMRIFTVGVGTPKGELLRVQDKDGQNSFIKDENGNAVMSRLNEDLLREIATSAKGFYLPLSGSKTIDTLYERGLAPLPKGDLSTKLLKRYSEHYQWPLALAILLLTIELFLPEFRRRQSENTTASAVSPAFEKKALGTALLLMLTLTMAQGSPSTARHDYEAGKFQDAEKEYDKMLEKKPEDARLHFNAGTAAFRAKEFDKAAKNFEASLLSPDLMMQESSYYNHGNALYRLGENAAEADLKSSYWEKSVQDYDRALKLTPQDKDAQHNLEFVKKKLEELKKQQEKQKQSDQNNQKQDKDKQDSKNQSNQKNQDQKNDSSKSGEDKQKKDQQQKSADNGKDQQKKNQQQSEQKKQDQAKQSENKQKSQSQQAGDKNKKDGQSKPEGTESASAQASAAGVLTKEQAMQLLDSAKGSEKTLVFQPVLKQNHSTNQNRIFKNW